MSLSGIIPATIPASAIGTDITLTREDMKFIAALVYEQAGIVIREHKEAMTRGRLARRVKALGLGSVAEYCAFLKTPQAASELPELINAVTTNHTAFFRERHHFDHLRREVMPRLVQERAGRRGRIRIWSSACSSGEEAYSIAATCREAIGPRSDLDFRILATDIDTDILARAEAGIYPADLFERLPADVKSSMRLEAGSTRGDARISEELRRMVAFKRLNLIETWPMKGPFDVIFCRNVFIYFDTQTKASILDRFVALLSPGGFLYLGHSESLPQPHPNLRLIGRTIYERTA
ncbi:protein-glutamate O-methyltransferase CheR [Bosea sp. SSUT16]|jgi:chemotaxis protein methyltransferase CheR|uniref:Chemotaxis protein methyltransferase n=1 Tax=Bosea spartocytisi TaxID=2773451 RepID=A0A927EAE3_9HYPH|nr:protein-glutamate O-methyltransferase CheR [Bosea spartocytisi]MBD3845761.1 protein-glutamate O-methyltransferase CheR [Bosea spartocytisi]MCT4473054.1 protein-glutamate O-methyltransferase CheR [Bosea spartocytisi]